MSSFEKKYQIFISSTYKDLIHAREEVTKVILNMYHIPIGMEMFSADNADQWDTIQETIDSSDYYILIIGHRYGSETKDGISYTEKEFDYAVEKKVPVLTYIRKRDIATLPIERDGKDKKLNDFIEKVQSHSMVEFWDSPSDLGQKISIALPKAFRKWQRIGWVKGDQAASPELMKELAELSKENRALRDENNKLLYNKKKAPNLQLKFNKADTIELLLKKDFYTSKLLKWAPSGIPYDLPEEVHIYYHKNAVDHYNEWFENNSEIVEKYNNDVYYYERSRSGIKGFAINLLNLGESKANDINISINFPKEIKIYDHVSRLNIPDLLYPDGAPEHPYNTAMRIYHKDKNRNQGNTDFYSNRGMESPLNIKKSLTIDKQTITLYKENLLHTKTFGSDNELTIYLMPLKSGKFIAEVEIICEEYGEPDKFEIPINVLLVDSSKK